MITVRPSKERGFVDLGWLKSFHSFSFGHYFDANHVNFRTLRVINEDFVAPKGGFPTHGHKDMEIITYPIKGSLRHKDSLGNGSVIRPGEVQRMSAGRGIEHSEFNDSDKEMVHLLQIWIHTANNGIPPEYEQKEFTETDRKNNLKLVVSPDGRDGSVTAHQDALMYASELEGGTTLQTRLSPGRYGWVQVISGDLAVNGVTLKDGDGAGLSYETTVSFSTQEGAHFLFFDLA